MDYPDRIISAVPSIDELNGFDYLVAFKQPDEPKDTMAGPEIIQRIDPAIVKGNHLVIEAPMLYRQYIE